MLRAKLVAVVAVGLSAAACSYNSTTTSAIPPGPRPVYVASASAQACVEYGFPPGSIALLTSSSRLSVRRRMAVGRAR